MESLHVAMPGYRTREYMLVLSPHEDLRNRIGKVREEIAHKFKLSGTQYLRPHLTLARFTQWEMMEEKIMQRLQVVAMGITPFKIELKDFGSFPTHSIVINVTTKIPVKELISHVKEGQRLFRMNNENKPHFIDDPYVLIASKLKPWQYEQAWLEYSHRQFTGRFIADAMLLLSRPAGSRQGFQIAARHEFRNLPVTTKQGDLFF